MGPGVAAALPMLYNAHRGGVPLVITAGQQHTGLLQYDPHLSGDLVGMGKQYSKWSTELSYATDIPTVIQRAFKMAMQPPTGPVFVSIPQDVLEQTFDFEYVPNTPVHTRLRPDRPVIVVSGDGSAAWNMQSFWTAAHYDIPVTFIITSNRTYRQVKLMRKLMLGQGPLNEKQAGMELDEPSIDFCQLAQSMGVSGEKCERPEDLGRTLRSAMESDQPRLIEVCVEHSP